MRVFQEFGTCNSIRKVILVLKRARVPVVVVRAIVSKIINLKLRTAFCNWFDIKLNKRELKLSNAVSTGLGQIKQFI